jgi:O-antigen ligase
LLKTNKTTVFEQSLSYYFLILFSIIPITIILGSSISLSNILLIDISFIILILVKKDFLFLKSKTIIYLLILYLYLIFNSLISLDYTSGVYRNLGFIRMIVLFAAFNYFFRQQLFLKKVLTIWSIVLFSIIIDIFVEFYMGKNILGYGGDQYGQRIVSFFKDEPIVGGFVNSFYLIIFGFLFNQFRGDYKNLVLIFLVIFFIAIFLTGERANSIKAIFGLFVFFFLLKENSFKKKVIYFFSILSLIFILTINSEYLKVRYLLQIQSHFTKNPIYFKIYESGFEVFKQYKFFGVGNKNYRVETCNQKEKEKKEKYICTTHPHQIYFEMLSEHGLLGTGLLFFIFFKLIFSKIIKIFRYDNYIQIGSLIYLISIFLPLIPSGAFFGDHMLTLFVINLSILYSSSNKLNIFNS